MSATRHSQKYKDKYLHLKRRLTLMRGGDETIRSLLREKLARLDLVTCDPDEMGDAPRVLGRIRDKLAALLAKDHFDPADVTAADALRGRLDRVFKNQPRTEASAAAHQELLDAVGTTQDLVRRFVCHDQPLARLPEDTTEAPDTPVSAVSAAPPGAGLGSAAPAEAAEREGEEGEAEREEAEGEERGGSSRD